MRWCALACVLVLGCKSNAVADAGALVRPPSVAGATTIDLHTVSAAPGYEYDIVVELVRDGGEVAWTAKLTDKANVLGDPAPDGAGSDGGAACKCPVREHCPCETPGGAEVITKSGRIPVDALDGFLNQTGKADYGTPVLSEPSPDGRAHVSIVVPTATAPIHLGRESESSSWTIDGKAVDHKALIDGAWQRLLDAVGARGWAAALHPLPAAVAPRGFADLAKTDALEIEDDRSGASPWSVQLRLERKGATFAWRGKLSRRANALGTSTPDRYFAHRLPICTCGVDTTCACEADAAPERRTGTVAASVVEAFLADVSKRELGSGTVGGWPTEWENGSPDGHVIVWPTAGAPPLHLAYVDASRTWAVNGRELARELAPGAVRAGAGGKIEHASANAAYKALLDAIGVERWATTKP